MLGFPMTVIGNAVKEAHEKLDDEVLEFAYTVAPQDVWEDVFELRQGFNSVKFGWKGNLKFSDEEKERFSRLINVPAIEHAGWKKILKITAKCFAEAPLESLCGACFLINAANGFLGFHNAGVSLSINREIADNVGVELKHIKFCKLKFLTPVIKNSFLMRFNLVKNFFANDDDVTLQMLISIALTVVMVAFKYIFQNFGLINLMIIVFILAKVNFKTVYGWKKFALALPVLLHNFGTTLFLTGPDVRYFYLSFLVLPSVILILVKDELI